MSFPPCLNGALQLYTVERVVGLRWRERMRGRHPAEAPAAAGHHAVPRALPNKKPKPPRPGEPRLLSVPRSSNTADRTPIPH